MKKLDHKAIGLFFLQYLAKTGAFVLVFCFMVFVFVYFRGDSANISSLGEGAFDISSLLLPIGIALAVFFLYLGAIYFWALLFYNSYRYELTEDSFKQEYGVLSKEFISVPYDNIQDIEVRQDVFLRLLGLGSIHIQTAGEGNTNIPEASLMAVGINEAKALRDELAKRVDLHK